MVLTQILSAVLMMGLDQLIRSRYGALGMLCLCLLAIGIRARNSTCVSVGAVLFLLLMAQA
ncbi:hypothetical protein ABZX56_21245 [Streptomyces parvulus]|uniref:hypothetical protein n=1 Tax=Streptomyces TaxID=1883 RepID=UPI00136AC347|nr:hypothetical protein [Streptomyces sp. SID5606]MZD59106.1 hypothetical protein [Streptomyces sp. SID5606]